MQLLCHIKQYEVGTLAVDGWAVTFGHRPLLPVPNVTAHPSTASVPIIVLLYNGPLLCGFSVPKRVKTGSLNPHCSLVRNEFHKTYFLSGLLYVGLRYIWRHIFVVELYNLNLY